MHDEHVITLACGAQIIVKISNHEFIAFYTTIVTLYLMYFYETKVSSFSIIAVVISEPFNVDPTDTIRYITFSSSVFMLLIPRKRVRP